MSEPAYKPQKSMINVVSAYNQPNSSGLPIISLKYQGIASMLMPCAKPEMALASSNMRYAFLFFRIVLRKIGEGLRLP
jgi:hypothetical protein